MKRTRVGLLRTLAAKGAAPSQIITQLQIRESLRDCKSVLDIGCGPDSSLSLLGFDRLVGIEGYAPYIEKANLNHTHNDIVLGDVRQLDRYFSAGQFDACVAQDLIEHLPKEDGLKLIRAMERVASRKVVFGYALDRVTDGELLVTATTTMFVLDASMRPARLPSDVASWLVTTPDPVRID